MLKWLNGKYFDLKVGFRYVLTWAVNRCWKPTCSNPKSIPIIINNRNRLTYMKMLIESLEKRGYFNIYIIDNASTYPPLLKYYDEECQHTVFRLKKNVGYNALWEAGLIRKFRRQYFVYTDSDIVLPAECPDDILEVCYSVLRSYPWVHKVGPALKIDDLPVENQKRVFGLEGVYWEKPIAETPYKLYKACIDTTFALHRPYTFKHAGSMYPQIRVGFPYSVRHMPWYETENSKSEESMYYQRTANYQSTWYQAQKVSQSGDGTPVSQAGEKMK